MKIKLSPETKSWLIGVARTAVIFAICFGIALVVRQHPKFYFHGMFALMCAGVFAILASTFRPRP